jgi:uncharacterized protein YndB with AHSA1/START domain
MSDHPAPAPQLADPAQSELGERVDAETLRFVRHFAAPVERVWRALTTPREIAEWLGRAVVIEPSVDGTFEIAFSDEDRMNGRILEIEPNRRLAIAWHETSNGASAPYATRDGDESLVSFDLAPDDAGGTILVFMHRYIRGGETMIGFGAGWHAHLAALAALIRAQPSVDRTVLYDNVRPLYAAQFARAI